MIYGGLLVLIAASVAVLLLAAIGVYRLRQFHAHVPVDVHCRRLERDLVVAIGVTMAVWVATGLSLLINPGLGATALDGASYSIARGTIMLTFGQCLGWAGFLMLRAQWWERRQREQAT